MKAKLFIASVAISFSAPLMAATVAELRQTAESMCTQMGGLAESSLEAMPIASAEVYENLLPLANRDIDWANQLVLSIMGDLSKTKMSPADFGAYWHEKCLVSANDYVDEMAAKYASN